MCLNCKTVCGDVPDGRQRLEDPDDSKLNLLPPKKCDIRVFLRRNAFVLLTLASIFLGVGLGFSLRAANMTELQKHYIMFPGELLLSMLQMMVLPLVVSSLITGLSSVDESFPGKIGLYAVGYYLVTAVLALLTGLLLVVLIKPGRPHTPASNTHLAPNLAEEYTQSLDAFLDLVRHLFPPNLVEACFRRYKTVYHETTTLDVDSMTAKNVTLPEGSFMGGINILGLVFFCVIFGNILGKMKEEGKPLRDLFKCLFTATMHLISVFIWYSPIGVVFLIAGQIIKMDDLSLIGRQVALYSVTVVAGLLIHGLLELPLVYLIASRKNPYKFMAGLLEALITAFGTASTSAALPVSLYCLEHNLKLDKRVTQFMVPLGAVVTTNGTALYQAVAAIFIAQVNEIDLNVGQILVISVIAKVASVGAAGLPHGGVVTLAMVLASAGLPLDGISYIITVDWMVDRLRSVINVLGGGFGAGVVEHLARDELRNLAEECLVGEKTRENLDKNNF